MHVLNYWDHPQGNSHTLNNYGYSLGGGGRAWLCINIIVVIIIGHNYNTFSWTFFVLCCPLTKKNIVVFL